MSARLHLPHPHIADGFLAAFGEGVFDRLFHHDAPAYTDPSAVARWAEWLTPDQWMAEHGRKETK